MPRSLTFRIKKKEYLVTPQRVNRKKLYGWTEIVALDEDGRPCQLVSTDDTGSLIIAGGGTAIGILSPRGEWVERSSLKVVNEDGTPAELITSSYNSTITLTHTVTEEEFLDYSITDYYQLDNIPEEMPALIGDKIYIFDYTYLDSYETTPAFILASEGTLFMMLGYKNKFEMLCLGDCGIIDEDADDYIEIGDDDIDFTMF